LRTVCGRFLVRATRAPSGDSSFFLELPDFGLLARGVKAVARVQRSSSAESRAPERSRVSSEFEKECVDFFVEVVQVLGVQRSVGQIYGLLFASPQPLSFTDIVEKLELSKGSASQGLQFLHSLGAVRNVGTSGDRRELFEPELALRKLMGGILRDKIEPVMDRGGTRLQKLRESAERSPDAAGAEFSLDRVKQLETWRRQVWLLLPVLKTILGKGSA
jgi:DNA-binding transcriptional regulator GbsR (MarR family)